MKKSDGPTFKPDPLYGEIERRKAADQKAGREIRDITQPSQDIPNIGDALAEVLPEIRERLDITRNKFEAHTRKVRLAFNREPQKLECPIHEGEYRVANFELTVQSTWRLHGQLKMEYDMCPACKHDLLVNERHGKWIKKGVPKKVAHATFENYLCKSEAQRKTLNKAKTQVARKRGFLILCGHFGNGKSHLAAAALKSIGDGIFITHGELVDELRETYDSGGKEKMIRKYQNTPCFVLDELLAEFTLTYDSTKKKYVPNKRGEDIQPTLYRILAYRFDKDLITVLTSNEDLDTVLAILGPRLEDRMAMNYSVANFDWESYRRQHREM